MKRLASLFFVIFLCAASAFGAIKRDSMGLLRESEEAFEKRDFDKAADLLSQAIEANPKLTPAYILRGLARAGKEKLDEAIADFSKAIELTPSDERPYLLRGAAYQEKKEWEKAAVDFTEANNRKPGEAATLNSRGICYAALDQEEKALADFDAAVKADPRDPRSHQLRGGTYAQKGDKEKALADYKEAMELAPNDPTTYLYRAQLYLYEQEPEKALADLEELMRRAPAYSGALNDYAWTLCTNPKDSVRNGRKAVEYAKKACHETDYKHAPTLDTLAAAHAEAGDWEEAIRWETEALSLAEKSNPDDVGGMKDRLALYRDKKAYRETPKREKFDKK